MFDSQELHLRSDILETLNATGLLTPYIQPTTGEPDWYYVNNCENKNFTMSWSSDDQYYELGGNELFFKANKRCIIKIRALERNIDNVSAIIGSQLFFKYCLLLDYEKNEIGLANVFPIT